MCEPQLSTVVFRVLPASAGLDSDQLSTTSGSNSLTRGLAVIGHTRVRNRHA